MSHNWTSKTPRPSEDSYFFPSGRHSSDTDNPPIDARSVLEALDEITACLRHYQAFGDRQELDESIFSLMALEASLQHCVQRKTQ